LGAGEFGVVSCDHNRHLALDFLDAELLGEVREPSAAHALELLGHLDADSGASVAKDLQGGLEGVPDAEGRLVDDEGVGQFALLLEEAVQRAVAARGEALECEARRGEAGVEEGEVHGAGAGDDVEFDVVFDSQLDEAVAGVADAGIAAIGAEGDAASGLEGL
jgi:hypothetical protein